MPNRKKYFTPEAKKEAKRLIQKRAQAKYRKTEKGKLARTKAYKKWAQSDKGKAFVKRRYIRNFKKINELIKYWRDKNTDKVEDYKAKYRSSEKGKLKHKQYEQSKIGKEVKRKYHLAKGKNTKKRYLQTEAGKLSVIKRRNKPESKEYQRRYQKTEKYLTKRKETVNRRYRTDLLFKLRTLMSQGVKQYLKSKKSTLTSRVSTFVGCSPTYLKKHLENQFLSGMNWDNYGRRKGLKSNECWEIDHIKPVSSIKDPEDTEYIMKITNYKNLQPMWKDDNIRKSNK